MDRDLNRGGGGDTLTFNSKLTEEFKKIAGNKDIKIKWNGRIGKYHLFWRGGFIMYLNRPINGEDRKRVKTHFSKLRGDWYRKNIKRHNQDQAVMEKQQRTYEEQQFHDEAIERGVDMLEKQSVWVTRP